MHPKIVRLLSQTPSEGKIIYPGLGAIKITTSRFPGNKQKTNRTSWLWYRKHPAATNSLRATRVSNEYQNLDLPQFLSVEWELWLLQFGVLAATVVVFWRQRLASPADCDVTWCGIIMRDRRRGLMTGGRWPLSSERCQSFFAWVGFGFETFLGQESGI